MCPCFIGNRGDTLLWKFTVPVSFEHQRNHIFRHTFSHSSSEGTDPLSPAHFSVSLQHTGSLPFVPVQHHSSLLCRKWQVLLWDLWSCMEQSFYFLLFRYTQTFVLPIVCLFFISTFLFSHCLCCICFPVIYLVSVMFCYVELHSKKQSDRGNVNLFTDFVSTQSSREIWHKYY